MWKAAINCIIKTIRHRKDRSVNHFRPNFTAIKYYEENFKMLHRKLKKSGKLDDEKLYNKIILLNIIENLCTWASHVQSVIEKEAKVPEKKAPSKFKFWGKKIEETEELPQPETYDKVFSEISANPLPENSLLPKSYIKVKFELSLGSGIFKLVKNSYTGEDFLIFSYTQLYSCLCIKVQGLDLNLSMKDLSLSSYSERAFTKIIEKLSAEEKLWEFNFKAKPNDEVSWSLDSVFSFITVLFCSSKNSWFNEKRGLRHNQRHSRHNFRGFKRFIAWRNYLFTKCLVLCSKNQNSFTYSSRVFFG